MLVHYSSLVPRRCWVKDGMAGKQPNALRTATINPITQSASRSTKERRLGTRQPLQGYLPAFNWPVPICTPGWREQRNAVPRLELEPQPARSRVQRTYHKTTDSIPRFYFGHMVRDSIFQCRSKGRAGGQTCINVENKTLSRERFKTMTFLLLFIF